MAVGKIRRERQVLDRRPADDAAQLTDVVVGVADRSRADDLCTRNKGTTVNGGSPTVFGWVLHK